MPLTPRSYPYPALSDPPNGAAQIQALAEAVDSDVQIISDDVAELTVYDEIDLTLVSPFSGTIKLRRYGNMVHCIYSISRSSGTAAATVTTVPVGWRPTYDIPTYALTSAGTRSEIKFLTTGIITEAIATASTATRQPSGPVIWSIV